MMGCVDLNFDKRAVADITETSVRRHRVCRLDFLGLLILYFMRRPSGKKYEFKFKLLNYYLPDYVKHADIFDW